MATSNTIFRIAELDFDAIKTNLKDYLRSQNQFSDYDFEGSGMNILLDVLAYNTHYMSYYLNMVANEMFIDSAQLDNSVASHAKKLNYIPTSRLAAEATVNVTITPPNGNTMGSVLLPKYTAFQSEAIDGINYTFTTDQAYIATKNVSSNTFTFPNVTLKQGEHLTSTFTATPTNLSQPFLIPSANVDTSTLLVTVQASALDTTANTYTQSKDLTEVSANSKVYFLQPDIGGQFSIYFGDNVLGKGLSNGNIIIADYLVTEGDASNKANVFTVMSPIGGFSNISTTTVSSAAGGSLAETLEEVKFRAPIAYTAQNRAVTVNDYTTLLLKDYPNIDQISVWSGEDNDPIVYGKVFISLKPKAGYTLTTSERLRIKNEIIANRSVLTITPELIDPEYLYVLLNVTVYYEKVKTSYSPLEIQTIVRNAIISYSNSELGKFNLPFMFSRLQAAIDSADPSIQNSEMTVNLQKRFVPQVNSSVNYSVTFDTPLHRGSLTDGLYSYPAFKIRDSNDVIRSAYIDEVFLSYTGVEKINVLNPGSGYTYAGIEITGDGSGAKAEATIVNGRIESITITDRGSGYTRATAVIIGDGSQATIEAILSAKTGTLETYYYKENGEKIILNSSAGTVNYETGKITLDNFLPIDIVSNPDYSPGIFTLNIKPDNQRIEPLRNRIVTLDTNDNLAIQITVVPV